MKVPGWIVVPKLSPAPPAPEPAADEDGAGGNTRITSTTGMLLLVVLALEGVTLLSVRQMITLHIFVGVLLLGPVLLKSGTTAYRAVRYYGRTPAYQRKGPPHPLLRVLGPFVILSSLALLGTGVTLIFVGDQPGGWLLTAHQTCFWIWLVLMAVHLLGHLWEAMIVSWAEIRGSLSGRAARGRRWRFVALVASLVIGVGAATVLLPSAGRGPTGLSSRILDRLEALRDVGRCQVRARSLRRSINHEGASTHAGHAHGSPPTVSIAHFSSSARPPQTLMYDLVQWRPLVGAPLMVRQLARWRRR